MPFKFAVLNPRCDGNLRLMCEFERLPEGNVVVPNNLYFKEYVRNAEVVEKWAASGVIKCHRRASAEEKQHSQLLFQYLLSKDYSARAGFRYGSVFLRTLPIDELSDCEDVRLQCCFRQPLKRADSSGSVESLNPSSSGDDREVSPSHYITIAKPSIFDQTATDGDLVKEVSCTGSLVDFSASATHSTLFAESDDIVIQDKSQICAVKMEFMTKVCCVNCGKWHEFVCKDNLGVAPCWTCSLHPNPGLRSCESRHRGFGDFKRRIGKSRNLKEVSNQLTTKMPADHSDRCVQASDPKANGRQNYVATEDTDVKRTRQVQSNPSRNGRRDDNCDVDAVLAGWKAKLKLLIVSHGPIKSQLSLKQDSKPDSKLLLHNHDSSRPRVDCTDVQSPDCHDRHKRRVRHSTDRQDTGRVQYEAPARDENVRTDQLAPQKRLKCSKKRKKPTGTKGRDVVVKKTKQDAKGLNQWPESYNEEMVTTVHMIEESLTPMSRSRDEMQMSTHTSSQVIFDLDEIMNIDHLF